MTGSEHFRSAYSAWLALIRARLEALEYSDGESDGLAQSQWNVRQLWRLRRECEVLQYSLRAQRLNGRLEMEQEARASSLLHDLCWLLDISPAAPPALARQCLRMAQDRISEEAPAESGDLSDAMAVSLEQNWAVA
jgi:hypothetical protein